MLNVPPGINHDESLENEARRLEREHLWEAMKKHWRGDMGPAHIVVNEIEHLFKP